MAEAALTWTRSSPSLKGAVEAVVVVVVEVVEVVEEEAEGVLMQPLVSYGMFRHSPRPHSAIPCRANRPLLTPRIPPFSLTVLVSAAPLADCYLASYASESAVPLRRQMRNLSPSCAAWRHSDERRKTNSLLPCHSD